MKASKTYCNATIPMLEICTTNNKINSSVTPTRNIIPLFPSKYRGADKSLARPRRKQATATEDSEFHISNL